MIMVKYQEITSIFLQFVILSSFTREITSVWETFQEVKNLYSFVQHAYTHFYIEIDLSTRLTIYQVRPSKKRCPEFDTKTASESEASILKL